MLEGRRRSGILVPLPCANIDTGGWISLNDPRVVRNQRDPSRSVRRRFCAERSLSCLRRRSIGGFEVFSRATGKFIEDSSTSRAAGGQSLRRRPRAVRNRRLATPWRGRPATRVVGRSRPSVAGYHVRRVASGPYERARRWRSPLLSRCRAVERAIEVAESRTVCRGRVPRHAAHRACRRREGRFRVRTRRVGQR